MAGKRKKKTARKASKRASKGSGRARKASRRVRLPKGLKRIGSGIIIPKKLPIRPRRVICVYGKSVDPKLIMRAAVEAYNKRRYTTHDFRVSDFIADPRLHNLMVKIAILDRVEEEVIRIYPDAVVERTNSVTLMVK